MWWWIHAEHGGGGGYIIMSITRQNICLRLQHLISPSLITVLFAYVFHFYFIIFGLGYCILLSASLPSPEQLSSLLFSMIDPVPLWILPLFKYPYSDV